LSPQEVNFQADWYLNLYIKAGIKTWFDSSDKVFVDNSNYYFGKAKIKIASPSYNYFYTSSSQVEIKVSYQNPKTAQKEKVYLSLFQRELGGENPGFVDFSKPILQLSQKAEITINGTSTFNLNLPTSGSYIIYTAFDQNTTSSQNSLADSLIINYKAGEGNYYFNNISWGYVSSTDSQASSTNLLAFRFTALADAVISIETSLNEPFQRNPDGSPKNYFLKNLYTTKEMKKFSQQGNTSVTSKRALGTIPTNLILPVKQSSFNNTDWVPANDSNSPRFVIEKGKTCLFYLNYLRWYKDDGMYQYSTNPPEHLDQETIKAFFELGGFPDKKDIYDFTNKDALYLKINEHKTIEKGGGINTWLTNKPYYFQEIKKTK